MSREQIILRRHDAASLLSGLVGGALTLTTVPAAAQDPDIRNIRPVVMLLVDGSGSMEYALGEASGVLPACDGPGGSADGRSRYTAVLEALTGEWTNYYCDEVDRRTEYPGEPDQFYAHPYHRPPPASLQLPNGILDVYLERVKFGVMTTDRLFGLLDPLEGDNYQYRVPETIFTARIADSQGEMGDYSYGEPRRFTFPGCAEGYMVDGGARNASASMGPLVSVGDDTNYLLSNQLAQESLLGVRPYGASPIAALLEDFGYYLQNDASVAVGGDPFASCRPRYAVLITDGQPTDPFRTSGCAASGFDCPYVLPSDAVSTLCNYDASTEACQGDVDGLFVVGFDVGDDLVAEAMLDDLAARGGTEEALMADDRASLISALSSVVDRAAPGTTTRTAPVIATGSGTGSTRAQYRFNSGFVVPDTSGEPWGGILDRTRFTCDGTTVEQQPLDPAQDSFHTILNDRAEARVLYTVATENASEMTGRVRSQASANLSMGSLGDTVTPAIGHMVEVTDGTTLTPAHFGVPGDPADSAVTARRDEVLAWLYGAAGSAREDNRLGDIYHSNPVVMVPPRSDLADESFNNFRRNPVIAARPVVVFVGTNDGVLHCFAAEDYDNGTVEYDAGEEMWGFVPPAVLTRLQGATSGHQLLLDGTPVIRDVYFERTPGAPPVDDLTSDGAYRSILVMGLRGGGNVYFALDVTDPTDPEFLWQFTTPDMGLTYARPTMGQLLLDVSGLRERAVALLPGGRGELDTTAGCTGIDVTSDMPALTGTSVTPRTAGRCWEDRGRAVYWLDVGSGEIIREIGSDVFPAPLTGGISMFPGEAGTVANRAFVSDDDGFIWRLDFSDTDADNWEAVPLYDLFHGAGPSDGQPSPEPPVLSTDEAGRLVILQASSNVDQLDTTASHRIVSITENVDAAGDLESITVNWEIALRPGEQVTGPLELFDGGLYFGTFESSSGGDACEYGQSRIWGVSYLEAGPTPATGYTDSDALPFPDPVFELLDGTISHFDGPFLNEIVMGVAVTQELTCIVEDTFDDPFIGTNVEVTEVGGGRFQLVAQVSGREGANGPGESTVRTVTRQLTLPDFQTRILSWVPQADR